MTPSGCKPRLGGVRNQERRRIMIFFEVVPLATAVDDDEIGDPFERRQDAMPDIAADIYPLPRSGDEGERLGRAIARIRCNHDEERIGRKREESLAAERMPLDEGQCK